MFKDFVHSHGVQISLCNLILMNVENGQQVYVTELSCKSGFVMIIIIINPL